ncbi:DUF1707 SHOCT-like domain-containing protein [Tessaracoccus antarcticus]|uniref:DUF1707 and DUF2154 domain-containing protein n=1 Tax=Tessaracoccus antarcticus TaxID=2479848 RepID=A0A3M0GCB6_9ACTN|nr:DUF1707 domain-containing protein [Tessaracoccus antarcticus]RMB61998.1 DUF1707 and DUF2154 domain-containing protein [Tessaracoccus antarcticus]
MSDMVPRKRLRAGDADRDAVLEVLQRAHGEGRLSIEELGERQDRALEARYTDQFDELVEDLPEGHELAAGSASRVAPRPTSLPATGPAERTSFSIMSGRDVVIEPGTRHYLNFAWWGGDNIDLTQAMGPGVVVTLELHAIMAGHDIYVPEGVRVMDDSLAIMAGNDVDRQAQGDGSNGTVILKGFLWWAGHSVKLRGSRDR